MKRITSSEFREGFTEIEEPVEVMRYKRRLGTWYPDGVMPTRAPITPDKTGQINDPELKKAKQKRADEILARLPKATSW